MRTLNTLSFSCNSILPHVDLSYFYSGPILREPLHYGRVTNNEGATPLLFNWLACNLQAQII